MKIWLDDCRPAPEGWTHARTSWEAIELLQLLRTLPTADHDDEFEAISLDHDLGEAMYYWDFTNNKIHSETGMEVLNWMLKHDFLPREEVQFHTSNGPARANMISKYKSYLKVRQIK